MKNLGYRLDIKLITNSSRNQVVEFKNSILKVQTTATPEKGKANESLIKILSKHFKIAKSNIELIKGFKSSSKVVLIDSANSEEIKEKLSSIS